MKDPAILRLHSKKEAKERIGESFWSTFTAGVLYILPVFALTLLAMLLPFVLEEYPAWIDLALYAAELLIISPIAYGFGQYCVARARGQQIPFYAVVEPLGSVGGYMRALSVSLSMMIRLLPITAVRLLLAYTVPIESAIYPVADLLIGLGSVLETVLHLAMTASYNIIADDPSIGSWRAVKEAYSLYSKHTFQLLAFIISFIGWMILSVISMGLLLPYLSAYQSIAFARMTDLLRAPEEIDEEPI